MSTLTEFADRTEVVLMDGGMGTTLEDRGVGVRTALWSSIAELSEADRSLVRAIHREFRAAGAEILIANTHNTLLAACREFAREAELGDPEGLLRVVVENAIADARAVADGALVAAGVGSVEGPYATESRQSAAACAAALAPTVRAVRGAGADLVLFETLTTREEIEAVAAVARAEALSSFGAGLTCGEGARTLAGVPVAEATEMLLPAGPDAIFVQCTRYDLVAPALAALVTAVGDAALPGVYANDGRVWIDRRWHGDRTSPAAYVAAAVGWKEAGARIVGGCCGTGPEHIRALAAALRG